MVVELAPHQLKAIDELSNGKVLTGGVGTGKTRTALGYFAIKNCGGEFRIDDGFDHVRGSMGPMLEPKDIYVITTARKRESLDWEEEAASFRISTDPSASISGIKLTVDSWNNIGRHAEVVDAFFVFDEQRLVGSGAWVKAFIKIAKKNDWIMLSATPGDTWMELIPIFVANGFYKNRTEFIREHVVFKKWSKFPKVERYLDTAKLYKLKSSILVDMPYERHTQRHVYQMVTEYDKALYDRITKDRWHIYEDRPLRDVAEMFSVARKLTGTDPSKAGAIMQLMEKHPRMIIFYNFDYELEDLRRLAELLQMPYAEWNGHKHQPVPEDNAWFYFVQYAAGNEAWNCIETDTVVFYSLTYSYKVQEQAKGRIDRLNTPFTKLYYYKLRTGSKIDQGIMKALARKQTFNEKTFADESGWELAA